MAGIGGWNSLWEAFTFKRQSGDCAPYARTNARTKVEKSGSAHNIAWHADRNKLQTGTHSGVNCLFHNLYRGCYARHPYSPVFRWIRRHLLPAPQTGCPWHLPSQSARHRRRFWTMVCGGRQIRPAGCCPIVWRLACFWVMYLRVDRNIMCFTGFYAKLTKKQYVKMKGLGI